MNGTVTKIERYGLKNAALVTIRCENGDEQVVDVGFFLGHIGDQVTNVGSVMVELVTADETDKDSNDQQ